jgi:hypothetical protein
MFEHAFDALCVEIGERRFIKEHRVHDAARGEMIDDKVQELDLISS